MFAPTPRMLWLVFVLIVPAFALVGLNAAAVPFVGLFVGLVVALLWWEAHELSRLVGQVRVTAMSPLSAYKDRLSGAAVKLELPQKLGAVDMALDLPTMFEQACAVMTLAEATVVDVPFTPLVRGDFHIAKVFLSATSPWRLWRTRTERALDLRIKVFPDLSRDPASRKVFLTLQQGQRVQRVVGRGREVERLRDYAPGDSFEDVYWKATARRGAPVSKVFQVERTQDIYAIVDGSRLGQRNQALERFVTASLLLAVAAEKNSDNFGLLTFKDKVQDFVRASHGTGHFHRCREAIFDLQPTSVSPDFGELFTFINLRIRKRALLFFLTDLSDPLLAETFSRDAALVARRHVVMVNQIADAGDRPLFSGPPPQSEMDVQGNLAGHLQWARLRELEKTLRHAGVRMHLLKPDQTSSELISQYMTIKQRQLL